jgi:hypothetical protein
MTREDGERGWMLARRDLLAQAVRRAWCLSALPLLAQTEFFQRTNASVPLRAILGEWL